MSKNKKTKTKKNLDRICSVTVAHSLVKNTVIRKALLDFIQALFAGFTCFDLQLLKFIFQILLPLLDLRQRTLTFIPAAPEVFVNLVPNRCACFIGGSFQSFETRSPRMKQLFRLRNRPVYSFWLWFGFFLSF